MEENIMVCGLCHSNINIINDKPPKICPGCRGDIKVGITEEEMKQACSLGAMASIVIYVLFAILYPAKFESFLFWDSAPFFGVGFIENIIIFCGVLMLLCFTTTHIKSKSLQGQSRTFKR